MSNDLETTGTMSDPTAGDGTIQATDWQSSDANSASDLAEVAMQRRTLQAEAVRASKIPTPVVGRFSKCPDCW